MKKFFFALVVLFSNSFTQEFNYLPLSRNYDIIKHKAYTLSYLEKYEQAEWVAYMLTSDMIKGGIERDDKFKSDPLVPSGSASPSDYSRSGYDKGHLCPAADMSWSPIAMKECFYMSNMSPQKPQFNRGIWKRLEVQVRTWAKEHDTLYVVTGGILKDKQKKIGKNKVSVPKEFYKVILLNNDNNYEGIGFILPNKSSKLELSLYAVPIDSVEAITHIDFFPELPDSIEDNIEKYYSNNKWFNN